MPAFLEEQLSARNGAMNQYVSPGELDEVIQAFASDTSSFRLADTSCARDWRTVKSSHKYKPDCVVHQRNRPC